MNGLCIYFFPVLFVFILQLLVFTWFSYFGGVYVHSVCLMNIIFYSCGLEAIGISIFSFFALILEVQTTKQCLQ